jgi:DNA-binding MarR family transcriptional regulator
MTEALKLELNKKTESLLPHSLRVLILIYQLGECTVSDLIRASGGMSATTITKYVRELESLGLISVTPTKTTVGTEKKIIKITDKGLQVINYIIKLNGILA